MAILILLEVRIVSGCRPSEIVPECVISSDSERCRKSQIGMAIALVIFMILGPF